AVQVLFTWFLPDGRFQDQDQQSVRKPEHTPMPKEKGRSLPLFVILLSRLSLILFNIFYKGSST
ncbi:MAG: hypothetical protein ACKPKO_27435, partial [Candidatus Fonsibacter sp.]